MVRWLKQVCSVALCIIAIGFFFTVFLRQRSHQDLWILDEIVIPTAIFLFIFLAAEAFVKDNKKLVILAAFLLAAMNVVPGLKYQFFSNVYDAPAHFRFTSQIAFLGYVPENEWVSIQYSGNPGLHIFMATISIVSGISVNDVFRFVIPALSGLLPLLVYFITKGIIDDTTQRYIIIASSFPIFEGFTIYGTSLAMLPYFTLMAVFIRSMFREKNQTAFWLIFAVLSFNVITSHAITSLFFSVILIGTLALLRFLEYAKKKPLGQIRASQLVAPCLFFVVLLFAWWVNFSSWNMRTLAVYVRQVLEGDPYRYTVPSRFGQISFLSKLQILTVEHARDVILAMLSLLGVFVFVGKLRRNDVSEKVKTFFLFSIVLLGPFAAILLFEFASGFGSIEYARFIAYALPLCTLLIGLALWRLDKFLRGISTSTIIRNLATALILFMLISPCLIEFYFYQPLVPRSNVLSSNLPENEYLVYIGTVNTIYQVEMISFAETYSHNGTIASDTVTRFQIHGFSSPSFYSRQVYRSPLQYQNLDWDLLLLHTLKAGPLNEPAENRTRERIEDIRLNAGNIIYDNGESFIISHLPSSP